MFIIKSVAMSKTIVWISQC